VSAVKIVTVVALICFSNLNAQSTSIKITEVQRSDLSYPLRGQVTISCTTDYNPSQCLTGANVLAKELQRYPTTQLGDWKFVLASTENWSLIIKSLGGDTESPAFTELAAHVTVLEDTLFEPANPRKANLAQRYGQPLNGLLDYAVSHEIGHALCHERNEKLADTYGHALRMGTTPICGNWR
jgi:hypothetical protein